MIAPPAQQARPAAPTPGLPPATAALPALLDARAGVFTLRPSPPRPGSAHATGRWTRNPGKGAHAPGAAASAIASQHAPAPVDLPSTDPQTEATDRAHADALAAARADAFAAGLAEGARQSEATFGTRLADLDRLADALARARAFDPAALAPSLAAATHALLATLLDADPELEVRGLEARAHAALMQLAEAHTPATLWLAPAQAAILGPHLARRALDIVADPTLAPGALRLTAGPARLDDSPAARLAHLAPALGAALAGAAANDPSATGPDGPARDGTQYAAR